MHCDGDTPPTSGYRRTTERKQADGLVISSNSQQLYPAAYVACRLKFPRESLIGLQNNVLEKRFIAGLLSHWTEKEPDGFTTSWLLRDTSTKQGSNMTHDEKENYYEPVQNTFSHDRGP